MCKVGWLDDGLRFLVWVRCQQGAFFTNHFGEILLCFGVLAAQYDRKFEVAEHCLALVFAVNHVKVSQRLRQHHNADMPLPQLAQAFNNLQFAERSELVKAK